MQCKVCNAFIPEGYMYCPVCGEEIIIVSDFEIKLEDNIDVAALSKTTEIPDLSDALLKNEITKEIDKVSAPVRMKPMKDPKGENSKKKPAINKKLAVFLACCGAVFVIGCTIGGIAIYRYFSYDHQFRKNMRAVITKARSVRPSI